MEPYIFQLRATARARSQEEAQQLAAAVGAAVAALWPSAGHRVEVRAFPALFRGYMGEAADVHGATPVTPAGERAARRARRWRLA